MIPLGNASKKTFYEESFLKCVGEGRDYLPLYPTVGKKWLGATPSLFSLYQQSILGYSQRILNAACNIAEYIKTESGLDVKKLAAAIEI